MATNGNPLTDHLDLWTSALLTKSSVGRGSKGKPEAYGIKKLRELILELAVRGKLVPQDPNDEPASVLLDRIDAETARLVSAGVVKKGQSCRPISEADIPFTVPIGWTFVRLGVITKKIGSGSTPRGGQSAYVNSGIPFLRSQNIWNDGVDLSQVAYISTETHGNMSNSVVLPSDILLNITGASLGRCAIYPKLLGEANVSQHVTIIRPIVRETTRYLHVCILSPYTQFMVWTRQVGMAREGLSKRVLEQFEIPLPPLSEQHRIVAKVDELMALCDRLEQQQADSQEAHQTLIETLLGTLTQTPARVEPVEARLSTSPGRTDFEEAWTRIADHFDTLFTTEHSIDQLKQTILQLAVMGKLVPQDPNDEPVIVPLEMDEKDKGCNLPNGWQWTRLNSLLPEFQNGASSRGDKNGKDTIVLRLADIENWKVSLRDTRTLTISEGSIDKYSIQQNDVLVIRVNGSADIVGRFILCDEDLEAIYCDHFIRMRIPTNALFPEYLALLGSSFLIRNQIEGLFVSTAGQKTVNQKHIASLVITLPPLAEQHRIVVKVDELMALCDALKARLKAAQATQINLADAIVELAAA